jgi:hypothetical protein
VVRESLYVVVFEDGSDLVSVDLYLQEIIKVAHIMEIRTFI